MPFPSLTAHESRVLGVLVEKAQTTPAQYPLTLNALTTGCNQKNNRDPVTNLTEDDVLQALDGLRVKSLVREALLAGSRVHKYRHIARETLAVTTAELVILTELLLRGPQAPGELRSNAQRMMPPGDESLATFDSTLAVLEALRTRPEPLVERLPRRPSERAERYVQLLSPDLHEIDSHSDHPLSAASTPTPRTPTAAARTAPLPLEGIESRIESLEREVRTLREAIERMGGL